MKTIKKMALTISMILFPLYAVGNQLEQTEIDIYNECIAISEVAKEFANLRDQGVEFKTILKELENISRAIGIYLGRTDDELNEIRHRGLQSSLSITYTDRSMTPEEVYQSLLNGCISYRP